MQLFFNSTGMFTKPVPIFFLRFSMAIFSSFSWLVHVAQCKVNYKMYTESTARVNSHEGGVAEKKRVSSRDAGPEWRREMREKGVRTH